MPTEAETLAARHADLPSHFVVEIEKGLFAICARTMVLHPGSEDFSRALIEGYLDRAHLRAATLPGWTGCDPCAPHALALQTGAYTPQTGIYAAQTGRVVVNVNNSSGNDDPKG